MTSLRSNFRYQDILLGLACCFLLAGCTPKRVVNNEIYTEDEPAAPASGAEKPAPHGKTGSPGGGKQAGANFGHEAAALARKQMGKMYKWGASGPDRFDCSGLVYYVYGRLGVPMPRVSSRQADMGREVPRKELQPGDMIYFATSGSGIDHVGIYVGGSKFVHAPRKGMPVRTDSLNNGWWRQKYRGARRIQGR
jgi:cell wall-associated NlpC family hydrolase